tara:strand:+ start:15907 stop:16302 length:396 start_codon:yes stop_codon:yes gene_type:complete
MSVPTKKPHTSQVEIYAVDSHETFLLPKKVFVSLEKYKTKTDKVNDDSYESELMDIDELFTDINKKYGEQGSILRGVRHREALTQKEFAKRVGITQADLSKMEHSKRMIGKKLARRIGDEFKVDPRILIEL